MAAITNLGENILNFRVSAPKDFVAGLIFVSFGIAAFMIGRGYSFGTATRMGPGYFPALLGALLGVLGIVIAIRAIAIDGPPIDKFQLRPLGLILAAILLFAALLNTAGLVIAVLTLVVIACLGGHDVRPRDIILLCLGLAALAVGLFIVGLGLSLKIWPWS